MKLCQNTDTNGAWMDLHRKKAEIKILLQDYMNFLPSGPQEAYVPLGFVSDNDSWPITEECERRMDKNSPIGSTYDKLDIALKLLNNRYPKLYNVMLTLYLHPDAGHSDLSDLRGKAHKSEAVQEILKMHELALIKLADYMGNTDLYVRTAQKAKGPREGYIDEQENFLATYKKFVDNGMKKPEAIKESAFHHGYSRSQAYKIVKEREDS